MNLALQPQQPPALEACTRTESACAKTMTVAKKMNKLLRHIGCTKTWRLQVYNAVIVSKLCYGLESLEVTDDLMNRLDAFQIRGLRAIMKIEHSSKSHITNEEIHARANIIANKSDYTNENWKEFLKPKRERKMKSRGEM